MYISGTAIENTASNVIIHAPKSGATCYLQIDGVEKPVSVDDKVRVYVTRKTLILEGRTCVDCHSPHPFIKSSVVNTREMLAAAQLAKPPTQACTDCLYPFGDDILLSAWADEDFDWAGHFQGKEGFLLNGVPKVAVQVGGKWHSLKHILVRPDILAQLTESTQASWTPKILEGNKVPACEACHELGKSHVNPRLAGTVAGLCD